MGKLIRIFCVCAFCSHFVFAAEPFSVADLLNLRRVQDPEVSPDGKWVAYAVREPRLSENKFVSHIWIVPAEGGAPKQMTSHEKGESRPKWSPDGKTIAFLSTRGGSQQVWLLPLEGGEARQLTKLSTEADNHIWSPDGKSIAFTSDVWPDLEDDAAQKKRADEQEASGVKAQIIDHLLHRHWTEWRRGKRTHIFLTPISTNAPRDLTPGDFEAPPYPASPEFFDISPDGKTLAFTRGPRRNLEAWSTDASLCLVSTSGGEIQNVTEANKGWDGSPRFSPDGKYLAYRSQEREGYEADKFRLALMDLATKKTTYLANDLDRSVEEILWSNDSRTIYFTAEDEGLIALYSIAPSATAAPKRLARASHFAGLSQPRSGDFFVAAQDSFLRAPEVARLNVSNWNWKPITIENEGVYQSRAFPTVESFHYDGALGANIQSWLLKPPGFDPARKYPCLLFIHGGPQTTWNDAFSFRWNAMTYAAHGYVVVAPNPHGSSAFGQKFAEQISGDWGGAVYDDVMKAADWAEAQSYIDKSRIGAAGASFGGYMVNWIMGHTNRFQVLVSHAGVFNLDSEYGATEELWFPEWEFKGPPWQNRELYEKFSPHIFAGKFKTPTLVTHGELDYRVPIDQGLQLFTALKRQGVESRLLYYPDEGHWILKLKNSKLYYETVFDWLDRYLKPN
jgi:dipeptidyl aminopeptidase/acylaminoacyl peptidase